MTTLDALRDSDGDPDAYAIVEEFWPYDGPYSRWHTASAATMLGRLVRYLNNATQKQSALPLAADASRVLDGVSAAVFGLEQLTQQLAEFAERQASNPRLYDDRYDRPGAVTALDLAAELQELQPVLGDLTTRLQRAASIATHLSAGAATDRDGPAGANREP